MYTVLLFYNAFIYKSVIAHQTNNVDCHPHYWSNRFCFHSEPVP